ncbi:uncharacterized protein LOC116274680 [Papio anubis]|uniref:uncharacterized protein LOC116274680 n=1 Tax=Papio anubis TaxID=9555 RepID=UPI0012AE6F7B|nr:uncharacterized protein LOC116274680 [Papio anubis]
MAGVGVGAEGGGAGGAAPGDEAQGPGPGAREPAETFRPGSAGGGRRRVATLARGCWGRGMWGWDLGVKIPIEPEKRLAARTLRLLLHSGMGGNPPASALVGGGGDGPEGWGPGGPERAVWAAGSPGGSGCKYSPPRDTPRSPLRPGEAAGGFVELRGNLSFGEGMHRARLQRRGRRHAGGLGIGAESGNRDRRSLFEEEEIQNSAVPGVRACVWDWEVGAVPRARARWRVCVCVCVCARARVCVRAYVCVCGVSSVCVSVCVCGVGVVGVGGCCRCVCVSVTAQPGTTRPVTLSSLGGDLKLEAGRDLP